VGGVVWDCIEVHKEQPRPRGPTRTEVRVSSALTLMPPTKQANAIRQSITLKGSTDLVTEFFKYAVNTWVASPLASA
jgi:hypothetical protein